MNFASRAELEDWAAFVKSEGHVLSRTPSLCFQQAANQPTLTAPAIAADRKWRSGGFTRPWLRWVNKPGSRDAVLLKLDCSGYWINECCFTPDGSRILTLGSDLQLWNAETGALIGNPVPSAWASDNEDVRRVTGAAFSLARDGRTIATDDSTSPGGWKVDPAVRVWDLETRDTRGVVSHDAKILSLAFSQDGRYLATGTENQTVRIFDAHTLEELYNFKHGNRPAALRFASHGSLLAVCGGGWNSCYEVSLWDVEKLVSIATLVDKKDVNDCAFSPDGERLVTACGADSLSIWEISTQRKLFDLVGHQSWVRGCDWSSDGKLIVSGAGDQTVRLWDAETGEPLGVASTHTSQVFSCAFSPDGQRVVSGDQDQSAIVWLTSAIPGAKPAPHRKEIHGGSFSSDGTELAAASSGCIQLWNVATGENTRTLSGDEDDMYYDCSYSPDGQRLAACSHNGFLVVWDLNTADRILTMRVSGEHTGHAHSCSYSRDGRWLIACAVFGITVMDAKTHSVARVIRFDRGRMWGVFSEDSNRILDSHGDTWDIATGKCTATVGGKKDIPLSYSPDRTMLLMLRESQLSVVDATTGKTTHIVGAGNEMLLAAKYTPDTRWIAVSVQGEARVYDSSSGREAVCFVAGAPLSCIVAGVNHLACGTSGVTYLLEMHGLENIVFAPEDEVDKGSSSTSGVQTERFSLVSALTKRWQRWRRV